MVQNTLLDLEEKPTNVLKNHYITYWNSKENLLPCINPKTKVYQEALEKIRKLKQGSLFTKYSPVDKKYWGMKFSFMHFQTAVDAFSTKATHKQSLSTVSLSNFLYNSWAKTYKSWFLSCLEPKPLVQKTIKCLDFDIYYALVAVYGKATNQSINWLDYQPFERNLFAKATNLLIAKLKETESLHDPLLLKTPQDKANLLLNVAKYCAKGDTKKLTISFLSAPWVISEIPLFMKNQGYLRSPAAFSIYRRT